MCDARRADPKAPIIHNPRSNFYTRNTEGQQHAQTSPTTTARITCFGRMRENGLITAHSITPRWIARRPACWKKSPASTDMYAYPLCPEYAISDVVNTFLDLNGLEDTSANRYAMENKLRTGGYSVYLCLDTEIQEIVEDTLANWSSYPRLRDPSDKVYQSRNSDGTCTEIEQPQAAACVFDYRTGG